MSRQLVTGRYINKSTYVLYNEDGSIFQTIKEGEPFFIDNQFKSWLPVRVPNKSGHGTILMCRKETGEEFPLPHNKKGLWATSSGAARNGVFHRYKEPTTPLEKVIAEVGAPLSVIKRVDLLDETLEVGGELCNHVQSKWGYEVVQEDCLVEQLTKPEVVEDHLNIFHRGCQCSTYESRYFGGSYLIYWEIGTYANSTVHKTLKKVVLAIGADETHVSERIKKTAEW